MATTTTQDPAEQLITLITMATTLTDEQKDLYLSELFEGRIHPELLANLDTICDREAAAAELEIQELEQAIATEEAAVQREDDDLQVTAQPVAKEHAEELQSIVSTYNQDCSAVDRSLDQGMESDVRTHEDANADAIRKMLKSNGDQNAA
jgi:hypothetical protein